LKCFTNDERGAKFLLIDAENRSVIAQAMIVFRFPGT